MGKAAQILNKLSPDSRHYKLKVKLLAEIIGNSTTGHLCPDGLVPWCKEVGLKTKNNCEDRGSWWTVSEC